MSSHHGIMHVEREMLYNDIPFGGIEIFVVDKLYIIVQIFEFRTFMITSAYDPNELDAVINTVLEKLWIVFAHYKANFIDTVSHVECEGHRCNVL